MQKKRKYETGTVNDEDAGGAGGTENFATSRNEEEIHRLKLEVASLQMELEMERKKKTIESSLNLDIRGVM